MSNPKTARRPSRLVSTSEAAELAGISIHAVARRVRSGLLHQYRDGTDLRIRLIDISELERLLQPTPLSRSTASDRGDPDRAA